MSISRNAPCPCGSGKKYKKCHGLAQAAPAPQPTPADEVKLADSKLPDRLMRFARQYCGEDWLADAVDEYLGPSPVEITEAEMQALMPWALFHFPTGDDGESIAQLYWDNKGHRLPNDLKEALGAQLLAYFSVYEVREVQREVGLTLRDLLTGADCFVNEVSGSRRLAHRDVVLGRVIDSNGVAFFSGISPRVLPPREGDWVAKEMRRACRVRTRPVKPERLRDPDIQLQLLDTWRAAVTAVDTRPSPQLTNTDGDALSFTTDHFDFVASDRDYLIMSLSTIADASEPMEGEDDGETEIVVSTPSHGRSLLGSTVVGRLSIGATRLKAESNSTRRADALRLAIEQTAGALVRHRLREETGLGALMASASAAPPGAGAQGSGDIPPEVTAMMRDLRQQHMLGWVDEEIPALGGLTPRQAAAASKPRAELELLLREFEHDEARMPEGERIDIGPIRSLLGMEG